MQESETENKKNEENISTEEKKNMDEQSSKKFAKDNLEITKETENSMPKLEKHWALKTFEEIYLEGESDISEMKTKSIEEEEIEISISNMEDDIEALYKYTFEEYLSMGLKYACSKLINRQYKALYKIEKKAGYITKKINFLNQKQESLRVKLNDMKNYELEFPCGNFMMKLMTSNPKLRNEVNVSYKIQYEEQKKAIIERDQMLKEIVLERRHGCPQNFVTMSYIMPKTYTMRDPEMLNEIEVSYRRQCDENLQAVKSVMKIKYESLLQKMAEGLQKSVPIEDVNAQLHSECKEQDFEVLNKIKGIQRMPFKEQTCGLEEMKNQRKEILNNLLSQYKLLRTNVKRIKDDYVEILPTLQKERLYKKMPLDQKYKRTAPEMYKEIEISYKLQHLEREEAELYCNNMLKEIKLNGIDEKIWKKYEEIWNLKISNKREKKKPAMKIQDTQIDTKILCELFSEENMNASTFLRMIEIYVNSPMLVMRMLQKNILQNVYATVLEKKMKSLHQNILYKHMLCGHDDKYTDELAEIIKKKIILYKNYHKKLDKAFQKIIKKMRIIEKKLNKKERILKKRQKEIEEMEKNES